MQLGQDLGPRCFVNLYRQVFTSCHLTSILRIWLYLFLSVLLFTALYRSCLLILLIHILPLKNYQSKSN